MDAPARLDTPTKRIDAVIDTDALMNDLIDKLMHH